MSDLAEFANEMSEILTGCREAREDDMLERARELVELERVTRLSNAAKLLAVKLDDLLSTIDEIEATE